MKPYRRNYVIGLGSTIMGLVVIFLPSSGIWDTIGRVTVAVGVILAGWSGRQWWYYERETKATE